MGTAQFLVGMTVIILAWVVWNTFLPQEWRFDHYPFIFLTLILSLQASYAAPLILLAQNRQEGRDRVQYDSDRDVQFRTRADMEFLAREVAALRSAIGEVATRDFLRSELRSVLADRDEREPVSSRRDGEERAVWRAFRDPASPACARSSAGSSRPGSATSRRPRPRAR